MKRLLCLILILANINFIYATTTKHKKHQHKHRHKASQTAQVAAVAATTADNTTPSMLATDEEHSINPALDKINFKAIANQPRLYSYSALAVNADNGEILVSKHQNAKLPIASISKLMTAMVLLDSKANLDEYVTISSADVDTLRNTYSRLRVGMALKRRDLLLLALMSSENRAAFAIARTAYPQGITYFIKKMNEKALNLGMSHTQFYDPTGLTKSNQSTAEDLAKMVQAAFTYPEIRADTTTKGADVVLGKNYTHHYMNSDALVRAGKLQIALSKTGFINEAGHCLVLYSLVDKQSVIMVFLNSAGKSGRLIDAITVKNYIQSLS
ncbi:MAG: hypothetical protein KBD37_00585 [Burkholderiales bacterium]|nr:hypothetical protein [Burkholderiales bacterium]